MKTNVATTSIIAYHGHRLSGKLGAQQTAVMKSIARLGGCATRSMIERDLFPIVRINAICPRVKELIELGQLRVSHSAKCPITQSTVQWLEIVEAEEEGAAA